MGKILKHIHFFIIALGLYNLVTFFMEKEEHLKTLKSEQDVKNGLLQQAKKNKKEITSFYKDINEVKERIERVALEIEKTQQLLPSEASDTENISTLRRMAEDVNIRELSITPENDDDRGFFIARKYKFKAKATYLQFLIMFEKVSESKRILNVSELTFKKLDQPQRSKFQVIDGEFTLEAYRYNPSFKEDRGIKKIEEEFKKGGAVPVKGANRAEKIKEEV